MALWDLTDLDAVQVEDIRGHPALDSAARTLSKPRRSI